MSWNFRDNITPEGPLLIMYNEDTDELGISAEGWELVVVANFIVFSRVLPHADDYEEYSGGYSRQPDGPVYDKFGYIPNGTITVQKGFDWSVVGTF